MNKNRDDFGQRVHLKKESCCSTTNSMKYVYQRDVTSKRINFLRCQKLCFNNCKNKTNQTHPYERFQVNDHLMNLKRERKKKRPQAAVNVWNAIINFYYSCIIHLKVFIMNVDFCHRFVFSSSPLMCTDPHP